METKSSMQHGTLNFAIMVSILRCYLYPVYHSRQYSARGRRRTGTQTGRGARVTGLRPYRTLKDRAAVLKSVVSKPPFGVCFRLERVNRQPPTLADYIQGILSRRAQEGKSQVSQSLYNLKDAAKMLSFLQSNNIMDVAGLDEKFKSLIGEQLDIQGKLKPVERRLATLKKHIEQSDIYFKYKGKKKLTEAEQIRKSVYSILRQEQPRRAQDMEH